MDSRDLENDQELQAPDTDNPPHPEQEHPVQDAHGGSMAPGLVDDTGNLVGDAPEAGAER